LPIFGIFAHAHSFVRPEYGDTDIRQLLDENILGDVLGEKEDEREAGLSNHPVEINSYQKVKGAVIVIHGGNFDPAFDQSIGVANKIQRLLWYTVSRSGIQNAHEISPRVTIARDDLSPEPCSTVSTMTMSLTPDDQGEGACHAGRPGSDNKGGCAGRQGLGHRREGVCWLGVGDENLDV
jgi:hypothetical protein